MSPLPFKLNHHKLLLGSAIALALFANPYSYNFEHQQWQVNHAYAKEGHGGDDGGGSSGHGSDGGRGSDDGGNHGSGSSHGSDDGGNHGSGGHGSDDGGNHGSSSGSGSENASNQRHGGDDRHADDGQHHGRRGFAGGADDNGVDAIRIDDDGTAHIRHSGDDDGPTHVRHSGDDDGPTHVRHSGDDNVVNVATDFKGDGITPEDRVGAANDVRGQTLTDAQEQAAIASGFHK